MKLLLLFYMISFSLIIHAQVQVKPLPVPGYELRITNFINNIPVVDTHEHLLSPSRLRQRTSLDFMILLHHYSDDDLKSAGLTDTNFRLLVRDSISVIEKWQILKPYWEASKNTAYNRAALLSIEKLFNIKDINESTVQNLSKKIKNAYQSDDWIDNVIKQCKIDFIIQDMDDSSWGNERFRYVKRFDDFINLNSINDINSLGKQNNIDIKTLDILEEVLQANFKIAIEQGIVAVKTALAYQRVLYYENSSKETAEKIFIKIITNSEDVLHPFTDVKPLQDYMMHRVLDCAKEYNIPVAIHTGLHSGSGNIIENSKPTHLVNLIKDYPEINFVLFHGSYPYGGELATIAKNFKNVSIDLCWLYIISPSYSERYLHEWLETIPASKIMGFGGDYLNIENVYGHLLIAKQIVLKVLLKKIKDGYFSESEAKDIAQMIFYNNAVNFYKLDQ